MRPIESCVFPETRDKSTYRRYIFGSGSRTFAGLYMAFLCTGGVEVSLYEWQECFNTVLKLAAQCLS